MNKRILSAVLAVVLILTALPVARPLPIASAAGTCGGVSVIWNTNALPVGAVPSFSISGPVSIQSSNYTPSLPGSFNITNAGGAPLPVGSYRITLPATIGTSELHTINNLQATSFSLDCAENNTVAFILVYRAGSGNQTPNGPGLRIVPGPTTITQGRIALLDVEYAANGSTWQRLTAAGTWSVANSNIVVYEGHGHLGQQAEFRGVGVGSTQVSVVYGGLTATSTITVNPATGTPPVNTAPCVGIDVQSNMPTNWQITGPASVSSPNYPALATSGTVTQQSGGGALPSGTYTITVPATVPGGQNPTITAGGYGTLGTTSGSLDCPGGIWLHFGIRYGGAAQTTGDLQYVKTVLDMKANEQGASQGIVGGAWLNNHFVFRGHGCSVGMRGLASYQTGGGGLWSFPEDGSTVQERQMCLDGGAASNLTYHHGINDGQMFTDGAKDFVFTNSTWAACVGGDLGDGSCAVNGPGATLSVYYDWSGDQVVIKSTSARDDDRARDIWQVTPDGYAVSSLKVRQLSSWSEVGSSNIAPAMTAFGGYLIGRPNTGTSLSGVPLKVYKLQGTSPVLVGDLPGNIVTFGGAYAIDPSGAQPHLVIYDLGRAPSGPSTPPRILRYRAGATSLELVSTVQLDSAVFPDTPRMASSFGVWGDYIFWPTLVLGGGGNVVVGKLSGSSYQRVQTVSMPNAGNPAYIVTSKNGYVAIAPYATDATVNNKGVEVYLYKVGGGGGGGGGGGDDPCTTNPSLPQCNPCITNPSLPQCVPPLPSSSIQQIPGQYFNITFSTSTAPEILFRMAQVTAASSTSVTAVIFGRTYTVDTSTARIVNFNWQNTTLDEFMRSRFVNVYGILDENNPLLIRAINVRNPVPVTGLSARSRAGTNAGTTVNTGAGTGTGATSAATQSQLDALRKSLEALKARLGTQR